MQLTITKQQVDDVAILELSGRMVLGDETALFRNAVRDLVAAGKKKILLNLGGVSYIDSSGLGELVGAFTAVRREGGQIKLLNLQKRVRDVVQIVKLETLFEPFDDETAALASFDKPPDTVKARAS